MFPVFAGHSVSTWAVGGRAGAAIGHRQVVAEPIGIWPAGESHARHSLPVRRGLWKAHRLDDRRRKEGGRLNSRVGAWGYSRTQCQTPERSSIPAKPLLGAV